MSISYSVAVFIVVLLSASILNLIKQHYVFQITGIAFLFMYALIRITSIASNNTDTSFIELYSIILPLLSGIGACLIAMSLGFWIFPPIRRKFKS